jgi:hypothetical protein
MTTVTRIKFPTSEERDTARAIIQDAHRDCLQGATRENVEQFRQLILTYASVEFHVPEEFVRSLFEPRTWLNAR